jgi:membrane-bound serine protease (ClpP class)
MDSLLAVLDGVEVETAAGKQTLHTREAEIVASPMSWRDRILDRISNPNIAYIFLMLGIYGLFFELSNPGAIFPGVVGAIFLILAFFSMQTLPVNYAGLLLILLALLLFILEVKITSYGLLTIAGIISMVLGSLMLLEQPDNIMNPALQISLKLVVTLSLATAAFFVFALSMALKTHRQKVTTGKEGLIGEIGRARTDIFHDGSVHVHGEIWSAFSDTEIKQGERVRVVAVDGMTLKVEKA